MGGLGGADLSRNVLKTEREGFEPSTEVASCNSLAGSRFQPLSHLSRGPMSLSVRPDRRVVGVEPGQPVFETAEDFPGDGLAAFAPVARGDFLVPVRA